VSIDDASFLHHGRRHTRSRISGPAQIFRASCRPSCDVLTAGGFQSFLPPPDNLIQFLSRSFSFDLASPSESRTRYRGRSAEERNGEVGHLSPYCHSLSLHLKFNSVPSTQPSGASQDRSTSSVRIHSGEVISRPSHFWLSSTVPPLVDSAATS